MGEYAPIFLPKPLLLPNNSPHMCSLPHILSQGSYLLPSPPSHNLCGCCNCSMYILQLPLSLFYASLKFGCFYSISGECEAFRNIQNLKCHMHFSKNWPLGRCFLEVAIAQASRAGLVTLRSDKQRRCRLGSRA